MKEVLCWPNTLVGWSSRWKEVDRKRKGPEGQIKAKFARKKKGFFSSYSFVVLLVCSCLWTDDGSWFDLFAYGVASIFLKIGLFLCYVCTCFCTACLTPCLALHACSIHGCQCNHVVSRVRVPDCNAISSPSPPSSYEKDGSFPRAQPLAKISLHWSLLVPRDGLHAKLVSVQHCSHARCVPCWYTALP